MIILFLKSILRKKLVYVLLIIQLTFSLLILSIASAMFMYKKSLKITVEKSNLKNCAYFSADSRFAQQNDQKIKEKFNSLNRLQGFGTVVFAQSFSENPNDSYKALLTDINILKKIKLPLSKGGWFNDVSLNNKGELPAVVSTSTAKQYKLGKVYNIKLNMFKNSPDSTGENFNIKIRIIGILKEPNFALTLSGNYLTAAVQKNFEGVIIPYMPDIFGNDNRLYNGGTLLFPEDNINVKDCYDSWNDSLNASGDISLFSDMLIDYEKSNRQSTYLILSLGIIILVLTIAGFGGSNALTVIYQEKEYATYYLCGSKWGYCIALNFLKDLFILIIPCIISYISLLILKNYLFKDFVYISLQQLFVSIIICVLIFVLTSLQPIISLYKKSPVSIIRKEV